MACNEDVIEKNFICSEALEQVFQKAGEHRWRLLRESKHSTFNSNKKREVSVTLRKRTETSLLVVGLGVVAVPAGMVASALSKAKEIEES